MTSVGILLELQNQEKFIRISVTVGWVGVMIGFNERLHTASDYNLRCIPTHTGVHNVVFNAVA